MNRQTFDCYLAAYNEGDLAAVKRYYTDDIVFENFGQRRRGAEVMSFLEQLHAGVQDKITPRVVLVDDAHIAIDADMEMVALLDLPQLPAGAMQKGEKRTMRLLVFYDTVGDKISYIRLAGWPSPQ